MNIEERQARIKNANEFISVMASCGRRFMNHNEVPSRMEVDVSGRVWFVDSYSKRHVYTHHKGAWRGFTNGGTMRGLVCALRNYIMTGERPKLNLGPWPDYVCGGDLWGYGDDMQTVRDAAQRIFGDIE